MSLGKNVVVHGATLKCSQSEAMSFLKAKDLQMEIDGKYVATVDDHKPADNILPFGICKHPKWMNKPCKPVTLTPWKPGETTVEFGSQVVIDVESKCKCEIGGMITIDDPGQAHAFFSVNDENYSHAALDFERVRNLHLKKSREWKNSAEDEADSLQQDLKTQLLNTAVETGKQVLGDDPLEIGLGLINPWKKVKLGSKLKNLPGAIKDTVRALRGGGKGATEKALKESGDEAIERAAREGAERAAKEEATRRANRNLANRNRREARKRQGDPPPGMSNPQVHHDLPVKHLDEFERRGVDINDPSHTRWVEGSPDGRHQSWSREFNDEWEDFFDDNPSADKEEILRHMQRMRNDPRFQ